MDNNTALIEAILYREEGTYVKNGTYLFEALDKDNKPLKSQVDLERFKAAVDYFFTGLLNTDLYVKHIPKASNLCSADMKKFQFD